MKLAGSWSVTYQDGTSLAQYDADHPAANDGEVPFKAIDWARVAAVRFESEYATTELALPLPVEGYSWSMRARTFQNVEGLSVCCYMLVQSVTGEEVNDASTRYAFYWLPDGATHQTHKFWSPEVADYAGGYLFDQDRTLPEATQELTTRVDVLTTRE